MSDGYRGVDYIILCPCGVLQNKKHLKNKKSVQQFKSFGEKSSNIKIQFILQNGVWQWISILSLPQKTTFSYRGTVQFQETHHYPKKA